MMISRAEIPAVEATLLPVERISTVESQQVRQV